MLLLNHNYYHAWDILGLYRQLFGHVGIPILKPPVPIEVGSGPEGDERFIGKEGKSIEAWDGSLSGTGKRFSDLAGQPFMMPLKIENFTFPVEPLISISGKKDVVVTKRTGLMPVVEEVSMDSYQVSIKGVFINEDNDDYPYRNVRMLSAFLERKGSLKVTNKLLDLFSIYYLVITDFKCDGVEGHQSMQWYTIEAIADFPADLVLKEGAQ